jgi:hypothetical protein
MAGRVVRLNIHEGETAIIGTMNNPGSLLLTVADPSAMEAKVKVDETDVPGITVGDSASLKIDAFPGRSPSPAASRASATARCRVRRDHGAVGLGQVHADEPDRLPRHAEQGQYLLNGKQVAR